MSSGQAKRAMFSAFAEVAKALAHPHRLEILEQLAQGERSVEALAERVGLSVANASQHLRLMRRAGLLASRREGKRVLYRLSDLSALEARAALQRVAERNLAEAREAIAGYFHQRDSLEPVTRNELARRVKDGAVTVLDVRPADEYVAGHLPRAVNVPLKELARRLREIPKSREIIAYCRGPYCVLAFEAVATLRKQGFKARRLEDGYPEWKAAGLPVVMGQAVDA
ncbi:MAG: metalloregulator ArsR/SmtB family transcription factor [Roseiarcus sp.]|jgi:ArsR family transcriptional regulator